MLFILGSANFDADIGNLAAGEAAIPGDPLTEFSRSLDFFGVTVCSFEVVLSTETAVISPTECNWAGRSLGTSDSLLLIGFPGVEGC